MGRLASLLTITAALLAARGDTGRSLAAPGEDPRGEETGSREAGSSRPRPVKVPDFRRAFGDTELTRAVDRGLAWLRREQLSDGSWLSPYYGKNHGIVSLALLAFLARGHEPGRGPCGDVIDRGIGWVLRNHEGALLVRDLSRASHGPMYSHGITTLLLGEVIGMVSERHPEHDRLVRDHRDAVNLILRAQNLPKRRWDLGGWRYLPDALESDLSVTGWQLLALRAARETGLPVPAKNIAAAVSYIRACAHPGGAFVYQPGEAPDTIGLTGTGVLALEICGEHGSALARRGGDWLLAHPLRWEGKFFYYGAYYGTHAMYQLGGEHWKRWKPVAESLLLEKQAASGSWPLPPGASLEAQAGPVYATAMAILALAVEFRYLPIYQR